MSYIIGLDLGTSALKGLLVNQQGEVCQTVSAEYPLLTPQPGFSEQNPAEWIRAAQETIHELIKLEPQLIDELAGISFSGQMHSLVLLDKSDDVLRPAILWNDVRTTSQCRQIMAEFGEELLSLTKNIALEGFTLPKILWVQENEPEIWQQVTSLMLPKDYLGFWLTGTKHMDYSDAAGTLLLELEEKKWSSQILETFKIPEHVLPTLSESSEQIGTMSAELQAQFGFNHSIPVFAGGADNACGAVAAGITTPGIAMSSIGTSGVFLAYEPSNQVDYQGKLHIFNHGIKDSFYSMGVTLAAGHSLSWFKETFAPTLSFDELLLTLDKSQPGANGLLFTPYIVGERTPHTDSQIRGSFIGLSSHHTLGDLTQAVVEGITFSLKESQEIMTEQLGKEFEAIVSVGGGAKNKAWLQIQANIFNTPVVTLTSEQGPGMGAVMIAAVGLGWFPTMKSCSEHFITYKERVEPEPENVELYARLYTLYQKVYPATLELSHELLDLGNN